MADKKDSWFEGIDPSDIRVLLVGIIFLLVPVSYFVYQIKKSPEGGFSGASIRERLNSGRGGFSFVQNNSSKSSGSGGGSLFAPPKAEEQWAQAVTAITQAPPVLPDLQDVPPETRMLIEAELNPDIRNANMLIELGRFDEAKVLLKKILDSDTDNVFLKCFASSNLCAIFDKEGKTKELEAEFKRYVELMAKLPPSYGFTANIESGLTRLANVSEILEKMRSHSPTQSFLAEKKSKMKLPSNLTADKIIGDTIQEINNIPGIGSFK